MDHKTRYLVRILTLDRFFSGTSVTVWNKDDIQKIIEEDCVHYGLKIISEESEVLLTIQYNNIKWVYSIVYASYKKNYLALTVDDERWKEIETSIKEDLNVIGCDEYFDKIISSLKNKDIFTDSIKKEENFKKYFIKE